MTWVTGSTGSPGHMVLGSLGRWVTKCDPVPCLMHARKTWHYNWPDPTTRVRPAATALYLASL